MPRPSRVSIVATPDTLIAAEPSLCVACLKRTVLHRRKKVGRFRHIAHKRSGLTIREA